MPCYEEREMTYENISNNKEIFAKTLKEFEEYITGRYKPVIIRRQDNWVAFIFDNANYIRVYDTGYIDGTKQMLAEIHALKRINSSKAIAYMTGKTSIKSKFNVQKKNDTVILRRKA